MADGYLNVVASPEFITHIEVGTHTVDSLVDRAEEYLEPHRKAVLREMRHDLFPWWRVWGRHRLLCVKSSRALVKWMGSERFRW